MELHKLGLKLRPDLLKSFEDWFKNVFEKLFKERENGEYPKFFTIISNVKTIIRHGCDR